MNSNSEEADGKNRYHFEIPKPLYAALQRIADLEGTRVFQLIRRAIKLFIICVEVEIKEPGAGLFLRRPGHPDEKIFLLEQQDHGRRHNDLRNLPL